MKTRKITGRIAALFLAIAMLAALTITPAFAAPGDPGITEDPTDNRFTIQKTLNVKENSYTPNVTFDFTVLPATALTDTESANNIELGVAEGVTLVSGAQFTTGELTGQAESANATFQVNIDEFSHAGVYKYTVSEVNGGFAGVTYTTETKTLYVYIINGEDGLEVSYTELVDAEGTKTNTFTNDYGTSTTDDTLHDVLLTKNIEGDGANLSETFDFSLVVTGDELDEKFLVTFSDNRDAITLESGVPQTVALGNGVTATIWGLSSGDIYTITEVDGGTDGYTTTVTGESFETDTYTVTGVMGNNDQDITYTNNRDASTPTGIVTDIAPYALMVVVAVAALVLFLGKRRDA